MAMWTRTYLALLLVRVYFAISPSYIHPDENFQGPEVIAGRTFDLPYHQTWEFTSASPVRSSFSLWPVYTLPMLVLKGVGSEMGDGNVPPMVVYYALRLLMFILSFVLEDWAIHELVQSPQRRKFASTLVASSYVTWTFQTHTFSNAIETLVVLWSLVLIQRIIEKKQESLLSSAILGSIVTFGLFNRITYLLFVLVPSLYLLPHFFRRPLSLIIFLSAALCITSVAVVADTRFYNPNFSVSDLWGNPTITPLNSLLYNSSKSNLSEHGLHPHYQHLTASLPFLLGPALLLLPTIREHWRDIHVVSAVTGTIFLSAVPHQEPRFLLPVVPLILCSIRLPLSRRHRQVWLAVWAAFNIILGVLMGTYHQGGVIPAQIWLGQQEQAVGSEHFWWRTYSPPLYLAGHSTANTTDLMGTSFGDMQAKVLGALGECDTPSAVVKLVAPASSLEVDGWGKSAEEQGLTLEEQWRWRQHLNLDDLDLAEDGILPTVRRVLGRRGLVIWDVRRLCLDDGGPVLAGDW